MIRGIAEVEIKTSIERLMSFSMPKNPHIRII